MNSLQQLKEKQKTVKNKKLFKKISKKYLIKKILFKTSRLHNYLILFHLKYKKSLLKSFSKLKILKHINSRINKC